MAGAADVSALRDPSMILRVQFDMLDVTPDLPDLDGEEFPLFEESPLDPDEVPLPEAGSQAEGGDTAKDNAKTAKPQEPDLDALFSMLREEDGSQARAQTAHRIQMRWIRSGSATVDLLMARAAAALAAKKPELALDLLDAVVRFKPDYVAGWNRRAAAHFMAGHLGKALVDIERTLALEPRHWGALAGLAAIQQATDKDTAALATYERILEIYPHQEKAEKAVEELRKSTGGVEL
ncbi:tetratricopeptide repeat protein [Breoghania sp.]|uniref:tetratricopeptide repeat protein n=1 Tax=Breoghania sp. TaxID=2065378 RepID=UPI0026239C50|nr:tetratricopeptide repeat protein [Breoghania sp.]MDJ0932453.1 tetratricopeptide repeat protein [Breoghania sp.]